MAFHPDKLVVYSNPYHAVDHKGRPAGAFPEDPDVHKGSIVFIGATRRVCDKTGDLVWDFSDEPISIPNTVHHRHGVMSGTSLEGAQLIAGDAATAKECGISEKNFESFEKVREATKVTALARWAQENEGCTALPPAPPAKEEAPAVEPSKGFVVPTPEKLSAKKEA